GTFLLFFGVLFVLLGAPRFLGALRFLLGFATGALLFFPALLLLALPVLSFAPRVLLLLPQRTLEDFAFLLLLAQLLLAPRPLLGLAPRLVECFRLRSRLGVGFGFGTRRKPGPLRKPCIVVGLGSCPRRRLGSRPRRGFFARARSLSLASDFLRLDLKSCVLARLRGRPRGSKRSEVEVLAAIRGGRRSRRACDR